MLKISKIISITTALALLFVSSSGSIKTISDEIEAKAAEMAVTGDVNDNSRVDILDLILTKSEIISSTSDNAKSMDVTGDNIIDFRDAREIQQYLLNQNENFSKDIRNSIPSIKNDIVSSNQPIETSVTSEMAAKADELGDAVSVYNYLYNNMRSEFYYGSRKGAIGAYEQGGGNDIDLSSLLIAMLRYLGYEADYVTSKAGFTGEQIKKWTNTDSVDIAHSILSNQNRNNQIVDIEGSTFYFYDYKYVQVKDSGKTYYLDVCFKEYENQKTIYDDIYITSNAKKILDNGDVELFNDEISKSEGLATNIANEGYLYSGKIVQKKIAKLSDSAPHSYDLDVEISDALSDDCSDLVFIGFDGKDPIKYRSAELYDKSITVNYKVSSDSIDAASILDVNTDSIFNLPPDALGNKMSVEPVVKINNKEIMTGPALNIGDEQAFCISTRTGGAVQHYQENLTAGEICTIVFDTGHISSNELYSSYSTVLKNTEAINQKNKYGYNMKSTNLNESNVFSSEYIGSMLRFTGMMYFSQLDINSHALAEKTNVHCESALRFGVIGYKPSVYVSGVTGVQVQGQKYGIQKEGQYFLDILGDQIWNFSKTGNITQMLAFSFERGLVSSELESSVIEEILNVQSLSTASILRYAQENAIPIVSLSKKSETKLSDLKIDKDDAERIQSEIDNGCTVISTKTKVTIGKWSGIGYIIIKPDGVTQKYIISGGYSGGSSIDPVPLYYLINTALDIAMIAESVMLLAGTLAAMSTLALGPVALVVLSVVSITFLVIDIMEQSFLLYDYEINDNMEAGMQIWANTAVNSALTLATMGVGKGISKIVSGASESRLSRIYGKTVVENIKDYGFTANEINSRVNKFKALGLSESTINTLLKDSKCMYFEDDVLNSISKTGANQEKIAKLLISSDPSLYDSILKNGISEKFIDILTKCEAGTIKAINNGIAKETIESLDKICGITPDIYLGNSKENLFAFGGKRISSEEIALKIIQKRQYLSEKFGEEVLNDLRAATIEFEMALKNNAGPTSVTKSNLGPAVACVYAPKKGRMYFAVNNTDKELGKNLISQLDKLVESADELYPEYRERTKGAGSHAEIKAFNAALFDGNKSDDLIAYVNYTNSAVNSEVKACSFITCPHCNYILDGYNILSDVDVVQKTGEEIIKGESTNVSQIKSALDKMIKDYFSLGEKNPLLHNNNKATADEVKNVIIIDLNN